MFRPAAPLCDGLPGLGVLLGQLDPGELCVPQSAPFERPVAVGRWPEDSRKRGRMVTGTSRRHPTVKDPMQSDRAHVCVQASSIDRHHGPGGLAEVALVARREEVVLRRGSSSGERHDVVDVQHDAGRAARATAVAAAEAIALQDAEAQLRGQGIAGSPDAGACRHARPVRRRAAAGPVPPLTPHARGEVAVDGVLSRPQARRPMHPVQAPVAGRAWCRGLA